MNIQEAFRIADVALAKGINFPVSIEVIGVAMRTLKDGVDRLDAIDAEVAEKKAQADALLETGKKDAAKKKKETKK